MGANGKKTSAAAWKAKAYDVIEIDDELAIKVKRVDVLTILTNPKLANNPLLGSLQKRMQVSIDGGVETGSQPDTPVDMAAIGELANEVALALIVEPRLTTDPKDDSEDVLHIDLLPLQVKLKVFEHIMGGSDLLNQVQTFPEGQSKSSVVDLQTD